MITEIKDDVGEKLSDLQISIEVPIFDEDVSDIEVRVSIGESKRVICPDEIKILFYSIIHPFDAIQRIKEYIKVNRKRYSLYDEAWESINGSNK